jgi:hypothetical protein
LADLKLYLVEVYGYRYKVCDSYEKALRECKKAAKSEEVDDWDQIAEITEIKINRRIK